jgi:hypothetical protein
MDIPERVRQALADRYTVVREIGRGGHGGGSTSHRISATTALSH